MTRARYVGVRPSREGASDSSKTATLFVALLVLLGILLTSINILYDNNGEGPTDDGEDIDKVTVITEDVLWKGVDRALDRPIEVMDGATLRLVDSDVSILFEDLVRSSVAWFTVHGRSGLELVRSNLTIHKAPQIDNAVIVGHVKGPRFEHNAPPSLSRVFNLAGTDDPVLNLDVCWKEVDSPVIVAGQASPDEDLETLQILECPTPGLDNWVHFEVPLPDFIGGKPRIVIFPVEEVNHSVMVSGMVVLDGGQELANDLPMTGNPTEDDWLMRGFEPIIEPDEPFFYWHPLMDVEGTVILQESTISSVPGLRRVMEGDQYSYGPGTPIYRKMSNQPDGYNLHHVTRGGQIELRDATLTLDETIMEYVPIVGIGSQVTISRSFIEGDHDLVTLSNSTGSVTDTEFLTTHLSHQIPFERSDARYIWAMNIENSTTPFPIEGCVFTGSDLALDLSNVRVEVKDCDFINTKRLAIWDHVTIGLDGWQNVSSTNSFTGCEGHLYLRTHGTVVKHTGPGVDDPGFDKNSSSGSGPMFWGAPDLPEFNSFDFSSRNSAFCMPTEVTAANGSWTAIPNVTVRLGNNWGGKVTVTIDTNETRTEIEFPGISPQATSYLSVESITRAPWLEGRVEITIEISKEYNLVTNYSLEVYLDGEHQLTNNWLEMEHEDQWSMDTPVILDIPPGRHDVDLILIGNISGVGDWIQLDNLTIPFVRLNESRIDPSLGRFLAEEDGVLLLDDGVEAMVGDVIFSNETFEDFEIIHVIMWEGSRIVINDLDVENVFILYLGFEGPGQVEILNATVVGYLSFYDQVESPTDFRLANADLYSFHQTGYLQNVTWENVTITTGNLIAYDSRVELCDVVSSWGLFINLFTSSKCVIMDSDLGLHTGISLDNSELNMTNVSISHRDGFWYDTVIAISYGSSVNISECSFKDVMLVVNVDANEEWYLTITDCSFQGEDAILMVLWASDDNTWILQNDVGTIANNTFSGHDSGIILQFTLFQEILGENVLSAESSLVAAYTPNVLLLDDLHSPRGIAPDLILGDSPFRHEPPMEAEGDWRHYIFRDVTEDPSGYKSPEGIWARVYHPVDGDAYIEDYALVYPVIHDNEVQAQPWEDIDDAIHQILSDQGSDSWWEQ